MEVITHFSHEHKLILNLSFIKKEEEKKILCNGCQKEISGGYMCEREECKFFLHERCSKIPKEINHYMHQEHPYGPPASLIFRQNAHIICDTCHCNWVGFAFTCHACDFDVCLPCCVLNEDDTIIQHKSHPSHQLKLITRLASFVCDGCYVKEDDISYRCTSCEYWIHKTCAFTPQKIECSGHHHPLFLEYSMPFVNRKFDYSCDICKKGVHPSRWVYLCPGCRFYAHVKCATALEQRLGDDPSKIASEIELDPNLIQLPPVDESVDSLIQLISKLMVNVDGNNELIPTKVEHFSHNHPLVLSGDNIISADDDQSSINTLKISDQGRVCNGCLLPIISSLYYACQEEFCNFFLHTFCSRLPSTLQLQYDEKMDYFWLAALPSIHHSFWCFACRQEWNGFFFCNKKNQNRRLCIMCTSCFTTVKHESHHHPLVRKTDISIFKPGFKWKPCKGCQGITLQYYQCEICPDFAICSTCALLPRTVRHDFDKEFKHPIYLSYPPFYSHPDEFFCEICEFEINPKSWLYHCRECDHSFHTHCLASKANYPKFKYGGKIKLENTHPHALTHVPVIKGTLCNLCDEKFKVVFKCSPCNFHLCDKCADILLNVTAGNIRMAPDNLTSSSLSITELNEEEL